MAKNLSQLQTGVRTYLDESAQSDFLDTEVISSINYAYHDLASKVMLVFEKFYETTTPFTYAITKGVQEYLIDSTLIKIDRVEINYAPLTAGSIPVRAIRVDMDEDLINIGNTAASGSFANAGYYIHGDVTAQYLGLIPIPSQSDTTGKSLSVWGIKMPIDLVSSTDLLNIPYADQYASLIEMRAAARLLSKGQQEHKAALDYITMYKQDAREMMAFLKERQSDGAWVIQDTSQDNYDFQEIS